jgi:hypothetical protein
LLTLLRGLAVILCLLSPLAQAVEVIVNRSVSEAEVSKSSARAMFAMRQPKWPDGRLVRVFVLADTHPLHDAFCKELLDLFPYQLRQTWDRLVFSGLGQAPLMVASEAEMVARVATTPGAIGYVNKLENREDIRALPVR